jgi:hypothetical protein
MVNVLPETNETEGESAGGYVRVTWSMFYLRPMRQMGESAGGQVRVTWPMFCLRPMRPRVSQLEDK